jgi:outer membrane protein assembly factor BamB
MMQMRRRSWILIILLTLILLQTFYAIKIPTANAASTPDNWNMFHYDPSHSGFTTGQGTTNSVKLSWNYTTGAGVWSSPAVTKDYVIVGSKDGNVYCLNVSTGRIIWVYSTGGQIGFSSPVIDNGSVYIGSDSGNITCINLGTMSFWTVFLHGALPSSPIVVNGFVYIGSTDHNLYCLNALNGEQMWVFHSSGDIYSSPALENGIVYFDSPNLLYAVDANTGKEIWESFADGGFSSPAVYNGHVYFGTNDGSILCFNALTGAKDWSYYTDDWVQSSPAAAYGYIYVGSEDNNIYCLNASDGRKIWQTPIGYWIFSSPAVSDGNVYVGSGDNSIYCLDAFTGAIKWNYATKDAVNSSPTIANGKLYVGSDDHFIYALTLFNSTIDELSPRSTNPLPANEVAFDGISIVAAAGLIVAFTLFFKSKLKEQKIIEEGVQKLKKPWYLAHVDAICILVILASSSLLFVNLGHAVLWASDEQTYAVWAYHMLKTGDNLTPWSFGGYSIWIGKPPTTIWLMSLSYQVFGVNNFAARFWSAVFGSFSLILSYFTGKQLYNRYVGILSAAVLGTFLTFIEFSRRAMMDIPLVFFTLATIYVFVLGQKAEKNRTRYLILSGSLFGLALIVKQVEALLIPIIILFYLIATERRVKFGVKRLLVFAGIGLLFFTPWLILMNNNFGQLFWQWAFGYSGYLRAISPLEGHNGNYMYYFNYLAAKENIVWVILLPFAAGLCAFKGFVKRVKEDALIFIWIAVVLVMFTFAQTKIYWYILPAYPAFAFAIASLIYKTTRKLVSLKKVQFAKNYLYRRFKK